MVIAKKKRPSKPRARGELARDAARYRALRARLHEVTIEEGPTWRHHDPLVIGAQSELRHGPTTMHFHAHELPLIWWDDAARDNAFAMVDKWLDAAIAAEKDMEARAAARRRNRTPKRKRAKMKRLW